MINYFLDNVMTHLQGIYVKRFIALHTYKKEPNLWTGSLYFIHC